MSDSRIKEHMEVIGADRVHVGTVDRVEQGRIKLTKAGSGEGSQPDSSVFDEYARPPTRVRPSFLPASTSAAWTAA